MASETAKFEKIFFWGLLAALLIGFVWLLSPFLTPLFFAMVIALALEPLYQALLRLCGKRRHPAAILSLIILLIFLLLPAALIVSLITEQIMGAAPYLGSQLSHFFQTLGIPVDLPAWSKEVIEKGAQLLYNFSPKVVTRTANFFLNGFLSLFALYFLLVDGPKLYHELLDLSPLQKRDEEALSREIHNTIKACIYGQVLTALVQAILAGCGFWIAGLEMPLLLGLLTFIMAFIPFLGSATVWVPIVLYLLFSGSYWVGGLLGVYGIFIISGVDNILKPILIQGKTQIHPALLFLAIFGGLKLWGPIGVLAGPTLVAVLLATLRIYKRDFR